MSSPTALIRWAAAAFALAASLAPALADKDMPTLIVDAVSGDVLHADEATRPWFPASTTKLMTTYVALRAVKAGQIKFDTPIVVSPHAAKQPPSKIGLKQGQELTLENALKILMVKSANDVAVVVAEGVGGSVSAFAGMMNREAARIGMQESHFVNPHGWHDPNQVVSARDLAILARTLYTEFPEYRDLWSIGAIQLGQRKYRNTNGLIGRYSGAAGMKTGFVCASGFNLVGMANRGGRTLIAIVLGAGSGSERTLKAAQLLDRGFGTSGSGGFWGSNSARTLSALTASIERSAPNRRADICGKRRGPIGEDEDLGMAMAAPSAPLDGPDMRLGLMGTAPVSSSVGMRSQGSIQLGPRADVEAEPVYIGRKTGSTEVARLPDSMNRGAASTAQAFAPTNAPKANTRNARLPGAITGANAAPARPAAAASLNAKAKANAAKAQATNAPAEKAKTQEKTQDKAKEKTKAIASNQKAKVEPPKAKAAPKAAPKAKIEPTKRDE